MILPESKVAERENGDGDVVVKRGALATLTCGGCEVTTEEGVAWLRVVCSADKRFTRMAHSEWAWGQEMGD